MFAPPVSVLVVVPVFNVVVAPAVMPEDAVVGEAGCTKVGPVFNVGAVVTPILDVAPAPPECMRGAIAKVAACAPKLIIALETKAKARNFDRMNCLQSRLR